MPVRGEKPGASAVLMQRVNAAVGWRAFNSGAESGGKTACGLTVPAWCRIGFCGYLGLVSEMKLFHTAMIESAELLAVMLENHGIESRREQVDPALDDDDLNQDVRVYVPTAEYDRAYQLFFGDSESEI